MKRRRETIAGSAQVRRRPSWSRRPSPRRPWDPHRRWEPSTSPRASRTVTAAVGMAGRADAPAPAAAVCALPPYAVRVEDPVDALHGAHDVTQVGRVAHLEREVQLRHPVARGRHGGGEDVDAVVRDDPGDVGEQPRAVERLDLELHEEDAARRRRPLDLDDLLGLGEQGVGVGAVPAVHGHAVAPRDEAQDVVAGHRSAAAGQLDPHVGHVLDDDAGVARPAVARRKGAGRAASAMSSLAPSSPPTDATRRDTTCCADTVPSPIAA